MSKEFLSAGIAIITAIIGVSIIATLVSKNSQTGSVITAAGKALSGVLSVAESPVTGAGGTLSSVANLFGAGTAGGLSIGILN